MKLQAAINGARDPHIHSAIPVRVGDLASAAADSAAAGAECVHFHIRDEDGAESLDAEAAARCIRAVRARAAVPVGVSTGAWIVPDPGLRHRLVSGWSVWPDFASVNFDEAGAVALAHLLAGHGVAVEAGLSSLRAVDVLVESGLAATCLRVLLEPPEVALAKALATVAVLEARLDRAGVTAPRLLHGADATTWPILDHAAAHGHATRIGFEDTIRRPDGALAGSNAELVRIARGRLRGPATTPAGTPGGPPSPDP
jgi:uncharacterized protein (DUF849 family)